jgi:Flp pilus assembly protein TadD
MVGAETPDADALAADMRVLAGNPQNLTALIDGAELTLKLGDPTAAAALYGRAEKIDPNNARIKAGLGSLLVQAERPGEALRRFAEAASLGLDPRTFAADRGLAYDLIGEQERAQRDYRLVLKSGPNETVTLRYALSLGISGDSDRGLTLIDPLVRANDRAAWRTRAFLMAMKGDAAGAENIAKVMMPGGQGEGLNGFFDRLPNLSPIDRAFAVHFGETRATPERLADARLAPPLVPLGPDPDAVQLAAASEKPGKAEQRPVADADRKDRKKKKHEREDTQVASAAVPTTRARPGFGDDPGRVTAPVPATRSVTAPATPTPVTLATRNMPPPEANTRVAPSPTNVVPTRAPLASASPPPTMVAQRGTNTSSPSDTVAAAATLPKPVAPAGVTGGSPINERPAMTSTSPAPAPKPADVASAVDVPKPPITRAEPSRPTPEAMSTTPGRVGGEDSILARIISNISVPGSELGVQAPDNQVAAATPAPLPAPTSTEAASAKPSEPARVPAATKSVEQAPKASEPMKKGEAARTAEATKTSARETPRSETDKPTHKTARSDAQDAADASPVRKGAKEEKDASADATGDKSAGNKSSRKGGKSKSEDAQAATDDAPVDAKAAAKKAAADKKAAAAKKAATEKAAADKKAKDEQHAEEKANPARVWVQVAGGAYEGDLPKAWKAAKGKAPKALGSRGGWTTPLRATNRVLAGPFKTTEEAQSFVNQLSKEGITGFVFQSDKGQKITKLPAK